MPYLPNAYSQDSICIGIIKACRELGVDDLAAVCAISCALVESNLKMYANDGDPHSKDYPYQAISKDKNSAGIYQQRAPWWDDPTTDDFGGSSDRMDVFRSTRMFINSLLKQSPSYHSNPGLAIANVQNPREDLRWKYGARMDEAWQWFNRLANVTAASPQPAPAPIPEVRKPEFTEIAMFGWGRNSRSRPAINFFLHTEEGNGTAKSLAEYCQGQNGVSYHYTVRDGIVYDVVDTDYYSWSVLDANVFSINLCFAGSKASWTREQWMERKRDIDIAAYLAVQDCLKYPTMSTLVLKPPYGNSVPGISDHRYVTKQLGIGTHWDVGDGFPWDYFEERVLYYNGFETAGDQMTKEEHDKLFQVWGALFNEVPSSSPYSPPDEGGRWSTKDYIRHIDGFSHAGYTDANAILLGIPDDILLVAKAMNYEEDRKKKDRARRVWKRIPEQFKTEAIQELPEIAELVGV